MLNEKQERELAYVVSIAEIRPLEGYDRVEYARIGAGWWVIVQKNQFKIGDLAIYFEIDSLLPSSNPAFAFMAKRDYKVKTLKMCKVVSQGLLMEAKDFNGHYDVDAHGTSYLNINDKKFAEGDFLTKELGITYYEPGDNARKANTPDKYYSMQSRHKKLFKSKFGQFMMKTAAGRSIMYFFFGKKKSKKTDWPEWVKKTDEERVQNLPFLFPSCSTQWIATEKIDGSSTTFTMKNDRKKQLLVCSRNVVFNKPGKSCYYETNIYTEMAEKYHMDAILKSMLQKYDNMPEYGKLKFITIQAETYGESVQKRDYGKTDRDMRVFNVIFGYKKTTFRLNPIEGAQAVEPYGLPYVPIVGEHIILPATCDELIAMAHGNSAIDGDLREGLVFRSYDGAQSFKAVDPVFLMKYHG